MSLQTFISINYIICTVLILLMLMVFIYIYIFFLRGVLFYIVIVNNFALWGEKLVRI